MTEFDPERYSDEELVSEFDRLFPNGFAGADVLQELAPGGWDSSPLKSVFHPSLTQVFEESLAVHRNINALRKPDDLRPVPPEPTFEEVAREFQERQVETEREVRELVGQCLWDIFSDAHEVVAEDGRKLDLGSFRGSGEFLADLLNEQTGITQYDYMDFYLGTHWSSGRANLTPVYEMIFRRLRARGFDWIYHFPRIFAVDMRPLKEALDLKKDEPEWLNYSPSESLAKEAEGRERDQKLAELRESLDQGYREAVEESQNHPPPETVRAYKAVFGCFPQGWPPEA